MTFNYPTNQEDGQPFSVTYLDKPDICPICHLGIDPRIRFAYISDGGAYEAQVVFQCPIETCRRVFIGHYIKLSRDDHYNITRLEPTNIHPREFSDEIRAVSRNFTEIFNEALTAENYGLKQICGVGYRKALEFLIKDYAICQTADENEVDEIKRKSLGRVIKEHISSENIRIVAEKAAWLGNDETHYIRIFTEMDVDDLKRLIELTVRWIEMEEMTRTYNIQMTNDF